MQHPSCQTLSAIYKTALADAMLPAQFRNRRTRLSLFENGDDLTVSKTWIVSLEIPRIQVRRKFYLFMHWFFGGLPYQILLWES